MKVIVFFVAICFFVIYQNCSSGFQAFSQNPTQLASSITPTIDVQCTIGDTPPAKLSQTCLGKIGPLSYKNFVQYEPQYPLYSDGATKRRWIYIPTGQKIDTSDPDNWIFPKGTIMFKEFSINGIKIETRQIEKMSANSGPNAWRFSNYAWTTDQADAEIVTSTFYSTAPTRFSANAVINQFKIPSPTQCVQCHDGAVDVVNGFTFLQLSASLDNLKSFSSLMTTPPTSIDQIPGTDLDKKTIGYIQSNCAICHSGIGPGTGNFRHSSKSMALTDEPVLITAKSLNLISMGNPDNSLLYQRFSSGSMPLYKPVNQDQNGIAQMRAWITEL